VDGELHTASRTIDRDQPAGAVSAVAAAS
jgi:hypothetical protein